MSQTKAQLIDNLVSPITGALGSASAPTFSFTADPNTGLYSPGADQLALATGGTQRLYIGATGRVGINMADPQQSLHVSNSTNYEGIFVNGNAAPSICFNIASSQTVKWRVGISGINNNTFTISKAGNDDKLTIDENGNVAINLTTLYADAINNRVGIGTSTVNAKLHVNTGTNQNFLVSGPIQLASGIAISTVNDANGANVPFEIRGAEVKLNALANNPITFNTDTGASSLERMRITPGGSVGIGTSSPAFALDVSAPSDAIISVRTNGSTSAGFVGTTNNGANNWFIGARKDTIGGSSGTDRFNILYGTSPFLTIATGGNVGIGTTSPSQVLHVEGNALLNGASKSLQIGSSGAAFLYLSGTSGASEISHTNNALQLITSQTGGITFSTSGATERARIDSSGRLLVGTSSAQGVALLQVQGDSSATTNYSQFTLRRGLAASSYTTAGNYIGQINFEDLNGGTYGSIRVETDAACGTNDYPGRLVFSTCGDGASSPTERMRISNTGEVKINEFTTTGVGLSVREINTGSVVINADSTRAQNTTWYSFYGTSSSATVLQSYIRGDGAYGSRTSVYGGTSDIKLKENIEPAGSQWSDIKSLQVKKFNFIGDGLRQIGVIAQEVEEVSPGLVDENIDRDADGNDLGTVTKSVKYSILYMKAVKALQEAMERIEQLESKVAALESA